MPRIFMLFLLALLIPLLTACGSSSQSGYRGYLYFANGSYLMLFSLRDGSLSVVTHLGSKSIHELSEFGGDRLLVAESAWVNRKEVHQISWVDVKTNQTSALYSGVFARFFADTGLMIYEDSGRLFVVAMAGDSSSEIIFTRKLNQISTVEAIPGNIVLVETSESGTQHIIAYHLLTGEQQSLDELSRICRLRHAVWIDDLEQLACKQQTGGETESVYVLTSLDGLVSRRLPLPAGKNFDALTYVQEQGALILNERWISVFSEQEKSAVWAHNIHSGENLRLARNQNLGSSVVYTNFKGEY